MIGTARRLLPVLLAASLGGCSFAGDATTDTLGIGTGGLVGALTGNPLIGVAAGVVARYAAGAAVSYVEREIQDDIQTHIALVAGDTPEGLVVPWSIEHGVPGASQHGQLEVVRRFGTQIECREVIFSVVDDEEAFFVGTICKGQAGWRWAVSEPSTKRWQRLQ